MNIRGKTAARAAVPRASKTLLKTKKDLYGLKQDAVNWFYKIRGGLKNRYFKQIKIDHYLSIKNGGIFLIYVDNKMFSSKDQKLMDKMINSLKNYFDLTDEEDADAFLGVNIVKSDDGSITMTQPSFIEKFLQDV